MPDAPHVDTTKAAADAIAGNLANIPAIERLANQTNEASSRSWMAAMERLIPGFSNISGKIASNIQDQVSGRLPSDVENLISRRAAEKGISHGTHGSEFNDYGYLRDLGLVSLEMTDKGLDAATRWMRTVESGAGRPLDFQSMFVSPGQRIATEQWNEVNRYNTQFLRNQIKMLPSNSDMAWAQVLDYVATWATTAASFGTSSMMSSQPKDNGGGGPPPPKDYGGGGGGSRPYYGPGYGPSEDYYGPGYGPGY